MSFWTYGFPQSSEIDNLLEKDDCTLEQLLDCPDVIQETRGNNGKLLQFLIQPDVMKRLIHYMLKQPDEDDTIDVSHNKKFQNVACELFCVDAYPIIASLTGDSDMMKEYLLFFDRDSSDPVPANNFARVMNVLLMKKKIEIFTHLKEQPNIVDKLFLPHFSDSFMDIFLNLVAMEPTAEDNIPQWLLEQGMIEKLIEKLGEQFDYEVQEMAAQVLVSLIEKTAESPSSLLLVEHLEKESNIKGLFEHVLHEVNVHSLCCAVEVLVALLERLFAPKDTASDTSEDTESEEDLKKEAQQAHSPVAALSSSEPPPFILQHCVDRIPDLTRILETVPDSLHESRPQPPVGLKRVKIMELLCAMLQSQASIVFSALLSSQTLSICKQLFFDHPQNNFVHNLFQSMIHFIISHEDPQLRTKLCIEWGLLDDLVRVSTEEFNRTEHSWGLRAPHMGQITHIAHEINSVVGSDTAFREAISSAGLSKAWCDYTTKILTATHTKNTQTLGGTPPRSMGGLDESSSDELLQATDAAFNRVVLGANFSQTAPKGTAFEDSDSSDDEFDFSKNPFESVHIDFGMEAEAAGEEISFTGSEEWIEQSLRDRSCNAPSTGTAAHSDDGGSADEETDSEPEIQPPTDTAPTPADLPSAEEFGDFEGAASPSSPSPPHDDEVENVAEKLGELGFQHPATQPKEEPFASGDAL